MQGLQDFEADELWRGGHPRFGTRPVPLSSVDTLACDLRPFPNAATRVAKQEKRESWYALDWDGSAFTRETVLSRNPPKHYWVVKCTTDLF